MELALRLALSYAAVIACLGGAVWYYGGFDRFTNKYLPTPQVLKSQPADKTAKKKKPRNKPSGRINSGAESSSANEKKGAVSTAVAGTGPARPSGKDLNKALSRDDTGEPGSKETEDFAKELAKAQQGIKFSGKQNGTKSKTRTVKQKAVDEDSPRLSAATSSAGQDGDDEITPAESPTFNAIAATAAPDTTGVSDMLEQAKEGPKSLRLTDLGNASKKKSIVKAPEPVESKKQRQQRRRREEEKERIAQSAKEHQAKGQQQMRAARMAEGTSNQTKADSFKAPTSVWPPPRTQNKENAVKQPSSSPAIGAPLDTFEPKSVEEVSNNGAVTTQSISQITNGQSTPAAANTVNGLKNKLGVDRTSALAASEREKTADVPNPLRRTESWADMVDEEEQLKMAEEDPASWESVTTKKDKKKAKKGDGDVNGYSTKQVNGQDQKPGANSKTNGTSLKQQSNSQATNRYGSLVTGSPGDESKEEET